ncbi:MAG: hypothetical protein U0V48_17185 [Anaerolineales bacterium]
MKKTSKKLFLVCIVLLTVAACATQPPVPTNTPLPPFDTPTPFVVPTNTPIITNETATTQPTQATQFVPTSTDLPSVSTSTPLPPVTGIYNPYAVIPLSTRERVEYPLRRRDGTAHRWFARAECRRCEPHGAGDQRQAATAGWRSRIHQAESVG